MSGGIAGENAPLHPLNCVPVREIVGGTFVINCYVQNIVYHRPNSAQQLSSMKAFELFKFFSNFSVAQYRTLCGSQNFILFFRIHHPSVLRISVWILAAA